MIEISMEIGMLIFWLGLLVTALMKETYFTDDFFFQIFQRIRTNLICLCVDHVIWVGHRILKLALNVEMFIYSFIYSLILKKQEILCNFHNEIIQPFLSPKCVSQHIKKTKQQKYLVFNTNFNIWHSAQMTWFAPDGR